MKFALRIVLSLFMIFAGVMHFVRPRPFVRIVPAYLPYPLLLVYLSGAAELLFGAGLLFPATQRWSAWGLVALYIAVFPANLNMAMNGIGLDRVPPAAWMLWLRLPLQLVLIGWAYWMTRD